MRWEARIGTPYLLWGKDDSAIDCSGFIALYAHTRWIRDKKYTLMNMNSTTLSHLWRDKSLLAAEYWDILYWKKSWWGINHIVVVLENRYPSFDIIDSSWSLWVAKRTIHVSNNWYTEAWWSFYKVTAHMNPIVEMARVFWYWEDVHQISLKKEAEAKKNPPEKRRIKMTKITAYYTPEKWQHRYSAGRTYAQDLRMQWDGQNYMNRRYTNEHKYTHWACAKDLVWYELEIEWWPYNIRCVDIWWKIHATSVDIYYGRWVESLNRIDGMDDISKQVHYPREGRATVIWKF